MPSLISRKDLSSTLARADLEADASLGLSGDASQTLGAGVSVLSSNARAFVSDPNPPCPDLSLTPWSAISTSSPICLFSNAASCTGGSLTHPSFSPSFLWLSDASPSISPLSMTIVVLLSDSHCSICAASTGSGLRLSRSQSIALSP